MAAKATVSPEGYHKLKNLLLVVTIAWTAVDGRHKKSCYYIGSGAPDKGQIVSEEALCDVVTWAKGKTGVHCVLYMRDGAHKEFSNSTMMLWLSKHDSKFRLPGEWVFTEPEHGKSDYDGLGAGIKKMLSEWYATLSVKPTSRECVIYLLTNTKGVPMRGKYSKSKEYRFKTSLGEGVTTPTAQTIRGTTKRFQWASVDKSRSVKYRNLPCFGAMCLAQRCALCKNKDCVGQCTTGHVAQK